MQLDMGDQINRLAANHKYGENCEIKLSFDESGMISEVKLEQKKMRIKNSWNRKKIWGRKNYRKNSIKTKKVRKVQII